MRGHGLTGAGARLSHVEDVATAVSADFRLRGIRHAIVGGLAVIAHGYERATADVDLLVLNSGRVQGRAIGIPGAGFCWDGVPVDCLFCSAGEGFLTGAVGRAAPDPSGRPIIPLSALVYLKIKANRAKDRADVVELLKVNAPGPVALWIARHAPHFTDRLAGLLREANTERSKP